MNAIALETRHSAHTWDIESRTPWHDWACWVPGRHHDELVPTEAAPTDRRPRGLTASRPSASPDQDAMNRRSAAASTISSRPPSAASPIPA